MSECFRKVNRSFACEDEKEDKAEQDCSIELARPVVVRYTRPIINDRLEKRCCENFPSSVSTIAAGIVCCRLPHPLHIKTSLGSLVPQNAQSIAWLLTKMLPL